MPTLPISINATGDTTLLAAQGARLFIRTKGLDLTSSDALVVELRGTTKGTIWSTEAMNNSGQAGGIVLNADQVRDLDTNPGDALIIGCTGSATLKGSLDYVVLGQGTQTN